MADEPQVSSTPAPAPADSRAALVAELTKMAGEPAPAAPSAETPAPVVEEGVQEAVLGETPVEAGAPPAPVPGTSPPPDAEASRRLEYLNKAERRSRALIAQEKAAIDQDRAALEQERAQFQAFRGVLQSAKGDPVALMRAVGFSEEELEDVAKQVYLASPAAAKHPQYKQQAEKDNAIRQARIEAAKARQIAEDLAQASQVERVKYIGEQVVNKYLDFTQAQVSDEDSPLLFRSMQRRPQEARQELRRMAEFISRESKTPPEPGLVIRQLEMKLMSDLENLGIDPTSVTQKPNATRPTARTLTNSLGTVTKPRTAPKSREEEKAEVLAAIKAGRLE